jgi:hypothetical protein
MIQCSLDTEREKKSRARRAQDTVLTRRRRGETRTWGIKEKEVVKGWRWDTNGGCGQK